MISGEPYEQLRAIVSGRTRRIIVWCGAGLSAPAGIPGWGPLQRLLEHALSEKLISLGVATAVREAKLRAIRQETNPWVAFHRLQGDLGPASFREAVRAALAKGAGAALPSAYLALWKMRPAGVINLNLDRLATRAYVELKRTEVAEFKGKELSSHTHLLGGPRPFVCNLHGIEDDVDSWVFTQPGLKELADTPAYNIFLNSVLLTSTILFVGITADDIAVGGHLERLASLGISTPVHYWITDRRDLATDAWAEKNNVVALRYVPSSSSHPELTEILEGLASFVPPEEVASPPITLSLPLSHPSIDPVATLATKAPEQIRTELNAYASALLSAPENENSSAYDDFLKIYGRAIHIAWYTSTEPGENEFLGLKLDREVAKGAFGTVFHATDSTGKELAVKLLHSEIRKEPDLLNAFRRGVRSMRILGDRGVSGMAKYVAATEIPATLVMEWIDGANLNEIVESGTLTDWPKILDIALQLVTIVANAHELPERVLHRDIRPSNVMIDGYWEGDDVQVRVLDFDLSWHRGSVEKSVVFGSALAGYLAPEQVQKRQGVSTQHASVDSYGLGMTIYYVISGKNPQPGEHAHAGWLASLRNASRRPRNCDWKSLPARIARLILCSTRDQQAQRWDLLQIRSELARLFQAVSFPQRVQSAELLAEELAARCPLFDEYVWDDEKLAATKDLGTGLAVSLRGNESAQEIQLVLIRTAGEADNRNRLGDSINRARDNVSRVLRENGWSVDANAGQGMLSVTASMPSSDLGSRFASAVESIRRASEAMKFA